MGCFSLARNQAEDCTLLYTDHVSHSWARLASAPEAFAELYFIGHKAGEMCGGGDREHKSKWAPFCDFCPLLSSIPLDRVISFVGCYQKRSVQVYE